MPENIPVTGETDAADISPSPLRSVLASLTMAIGGVGVCYFAFRLMGGVFQYVVARLFNPLDLFAMATEVPTQIALFLASACLLGLGYFLNRMPRVSLGPSEIVDAKSVPSPADDSSAGR